MTERGYKDATVDEEQIKLWWSDHPDAAIGLPTGAPGFTVLDVDVHADGDGYLALERLRCLGLLRGAVRVVATPSGGLHLYFCGSEAASRRWVSDHIEVKGVGGYVIAPPSHLTIDGEPPASYLEKERREVGSELDVAELDKVLTKTVATPGGGISSLVRVVDSAALGNRNNALHWATNRAIECGYPLDALVAAGRRSGLSEAEVAKVVTSVVSSNGGAA